MKLYVFKCSQCGSLHALEEADRMRSVGPSLVVGQRYEQCLIRRNTDTPCAGWLCYTGLLNTAPVLADTTTEPAPV